jgi:hypothetical protein
MPQHRSLTLEKLVKAIDPGLLERYFTEKLRGKGELPFRIIMDWPAIQQFMADERNAQATALVIEDLSRINDICEKAKNHVVRAYRQFNISWDQNDSPENLAMKLFLDHDDAFDFAYTWYCYYHTSSTLSSHRIPGKFKLTESKLAKFLKETREWFGQLAKGRQCLVTHYDEADSTVILIKHGSYVKTVAYWKENEIDVTSFRPASEDVLLYEKTPGLLRIKASLPKDREQYIASFSECIMGDASLAESEDRDTVYTLKPLQDGTFNWDGNEDIKQIMLTEVKLRLPGGTEPMVNISSGDVRKSLKESLRGIKLEAGELTFAKLRFALKVDGKKPRVSVEISPPARSNLNQKRHAEIISAYLKAQKVELV